MTLGFAMAAVGAGVGDFLDSIFDDRLYYLPGEGVNREAQGIAFSMLFLYKAKWLGYLAWSLGIILLLVGTPRRKLFAWYDRRVGLPWDPFLKKTGTWLFAIGTVGAVIQFYGVAGVFLGTVREIQLMTTGDMQVLVEVPGWFRTLDTILDTWALANILGMIIFGAGSKTVRRIILTIGSLGSSGSSSGSGTSTSNQSSGSGEGGSGASGSGEVASGGAAQAGQAAEAAGRWGGGGRGR